MEKASYLTTSWDDGHPLDMRLVALLAKYDMPATFYVPLQSQRPVLDRAGIRELAAQFDIGAHSLRHLNLRQLPPAEARSEIVDSKRYIEDITGAPCSVFAPPGGHYRRSHLEMARQAGYHGMRTVELMSLSHPARQAGFAVLPTSLQMYPHTMHAYARNAAKRLRPANLITYFAHARGEDLARMAESLAARVVELGGTFHLWGHSWEIEEMDLWSTLERILCCLRPASSRCRLVSNTALCKETQQHEPLTIPA